MRILYVVKGVNQHAGVKRKIEDMVHAWRTLGCIVEIYDLDVNSYLLKSSFFSRFISRLLKVSSYFYDRKLSKRVFDFNPDVIYWRFGPIPLLQKYDDKINLIVESNTNLDVESKTRSLPVRLAIYLYLRKITSVCSGAVGVTNDCLTAFSSLERSVVIGNSINFDHELFRDILKRRVQCKRKSAIFLGMKGAPWHGIDRLLRTAKELEGVDFKVVGYDKSDLIKIKDELPSNVYALGQAEGRELGEILQSVDIAFGSLAMERAGMKESSSLKNRMYLQYALPIIMQGRDSDLEGLPGIYFLPRSFTVEEAQLATLDAINFNFDESHSTLIKRRIDSNEVERKRVAFFRSFVRS